MEALAVLTIIGATGAAVAYLHTVFVRRQDIDRLESRIEHLEDRDNV